MLSFYRKFFSFLHIFNNTQKCTFSLNNCILLIKVKNMYKKREMAIIKVKREYEIALTLFL